MRNKIIKRYIVAPIILLLITAAFAACEKDTVISNNNTALEERSEQALEGEESPDVPVVTEEPVTARQITVIGDTAADEPILMPKPPFGYYASGNITRKAGRVIKLNGISEKTNNITDEDEWFLNNDLTLNDYSQGSSQDSTGDIPDEIDREVNGLVRISVIHDDSYTYCIYGSDYLEGYILNIYDVKTNKKVYSLDFSNYRYSPDYVKEDYGFIRQKINWAEIKGNILYVSNSHNTYAKSSKNMNAYITAIDLNDMSILWRTDPLVSNSRNFLIIGDVIICGYGFTDEDDFLYQVDRNNGKVLEKTPLKTAPYYIIEKDNVLYVRTYNTDYEFEIVR